MRILSSTKFIFILLFMILFMTKTMLSQTCHYSCANCTGPSYISCFSCTDPGDTLTVLQDPQIIDPLYRHSIYQSGICTAKVPQGPNGLGIFLLIISIITLLITQSHQLFYISSTFQTLALFGLLQVPWLQPASFILQAFQYFMPINIILSPSKNNDYKLFIYSFYRLDEYMTSTQDIGLITVFIIDCVLFFFIVVIFALTLFRRRRQALMEEQKKNKADQNGNNLVPQFSNTSQNDIVELKKSKDIKMHSKKVNKNQIFETQSDLIKTQEAPKTCKEKLVKVICEKASQCLILRKILHITIYIFYFFVQETALSIMVGAVFDISTLDVAIWIVYFIQIVSVLVISIYETEVDKQLNPEVKDTKDFGLSLFLSRECLFIVLLKKIVLPLGVVIPPEVQYIYFALYLVLFLLQGSVDARSGRVACISRITLWKIFEMCITTLILTFFFNERNGSSASNSNLITIVLTITLVVFIISFFVEAVISIVFMFVGLTQVHNTFQQTPIKNQKNLQLNNTQMALNQIEKDHPNIFENIQMTRQNTKSPRHIQNTYQSQNKSKFKKQTIEVEEFSQHENEDIAKPPIINNQLLINKSKDNEKLKPSSDKNQSKQTKQQHSQKLQPNKDKKTEQKQRFQNQQQKNEEGDHDKKGENKVKRKRIEDPELRRRYGIK